jgi:hypothetical protein
MCQQFSPTFGFLPPLVDHGNMRVYVQVMFVCSLAGR